MKRIGLGTALAALLTLGVAPSASATIIVAVDLDATTDAIESSATLPGSAVTLYNARLVAWSDADDDGTIGDGTLDVTSFLLQLFSSGDEAKISLPTVGSLAAGTLGLGAAGAAVPTAESTADVSWAVGAGGATPNLLLPVVTSGDPLASAAELLRFSYRVDGINGNTSTLDLTTTGPFGVTFTDAQLNLVATSTRLARVTQADVPAPGALALLATGLLAFGARTRRRS